MWESWIEEACENLCIVCMRRGSTLNELYSPIEPNEQKKPLDSIHVTRSCGYSNKN